MQCYFTVYFFPFALIISINDVISCSFNLFHVEKRFKIRNSLLSTTVTEYCTCSLCNISFFPTQTHRTRKKKYKKGEGESGRTFQNSRFLFRAFCFRGFCRNSMTIMDWLWNVISFIR
jgi:hypothetical protein